MKFKLTILVFFLLTACAGPANLGYVGDGIYRSGQSWSLYPVLETLNLKTIINIGYSELDSKDAYEADWCGERGIAFCAFDDLGPPPDPRFDLIIEILQTCEKPVLVHCSAGRDRTGSIVAVYKREIMQSTLRNIIEDWWVHGIPNEQWLVFLFERLK